MNSASKKLRKEIRNFATFAHTGLSVQLYSALHICIGGGLISTIKIKLQVFFRQAGPNLPHSPQACSSDFPSSLRALLVLFSINQI